MRIPAYLHEIMFALKRAKAQLKHQGKPVTVEVYLFKYGFKNQNGIL
jgi:hypothetical protein